jgi:hypothetical protein
MMPPTAIKSMNLPHGKRTAVGMMISITGERRGEERIALLLLLHLLL